MCQCGEFQIMKIFKRITGTVSDLFHKVLLTGFRRKIASASKVFRLKRYETQSIIICTSLNEFRKLIKLWKPDS